MKRNLLIVTALLLSSIVSKAQSWIVQNTNFPIEYTFVQEISAPAAGIAWATSQDVVAGDNFIDFTRTIDGGNTWTVGTVGTDTNFQFSNIRAVNGDTAWVAMQNASLGTGAIFKTTDGGVTWPQQGAGSIFNTAGTSFVNIVYFWDADTGMAMGDPVGGFFEIYTTVDGGATWTRTPSADIPNPLPTLGGGEYGIQRNYNVFGNTIWFNTDRGRVFKSVDKGLHWTVSTVATTSILSTTRSMNIRFLDNLNGLAQIITNSTGAIYRVYRTTDGGASWVLQAITGKFFTSDFGHIPGTSMYMSCGDGNSYSTDLGLSWVTVDTTQYYACLGSYDIDNTWAGNYDTLDINFVMQGGVFKFDPGILNVKNEVNLKAEVVAYPNPSTGIVNVNFKVGNTTDVRALVVNMMGEEVYSEKFTAVSQFRHTFDFSRLSKGVYFINLEYGSNRSTEKLVIQ